MRYNQYALHSHRLSIVSLTWVVILITTFSAVHVCQASAVSPMHWVVVAAMLLGPMECSNTPVAQNLRTEYTVIIHVALNHHRRTYTSIYHFDHYIQQDVHENYKYGNFLPI